VLPLVPIGRRYGVEVAVADRKEIALIDTQSEEPFALAPAVAGRMPFLAAPLAIGRATIPGHGHVKREAARLAGSVRFGRYVFEEPILSIHPPPEGEAAPGMLLGGPILGQFALTLDQRNRLARFARDGSDPFQRPASIRGFGFSTFRSPSGVILVDHVIPGTDAERLGVREADELARIDGGAAAEVDRGAWEVLEHGDRPVAFVFLRGTEGLEVVLTPVLLVE
jgi:hypothetical protein